LPKDSLFHPSSQSGTQAEAGAAAILAETVGIPVMTLLVQE